ncbi:MAG: hypothetical protein HY329_14935, partial [Chloroflexi bacterium]|nr:hypothetical protein [Chloroflexota bacterium]
PAASAGALSFSGSGTGSTGRFSLVPGLTTFRFTHDGSRVFSVRLINAATGQLEELLVFSLGGFAGSTAIQVRNAGEYQVNVEADGRWTAVVESPRPTTAPSAPVTLTCRGTEITPFFRLPGGPITFSYQHSGSRNFIAHLRDSTGRIEDFIANQIGAVTGTKGSSPPVGIYFAEVIADGDWTISIALGGGAGDSPTATATITPFASTTTPTAAATPSPTPTARP